MRGSARPKALRYSSVFQNTYNVSEKYLKRIWDKAEANGNAIEFKAIWLESIGEN